MTPTAEEVKRYALKYYDYEGMACVATNGVPFAGKTPFDELDGERTLDVVLAQDHDRIVSSLSAEVERLTMALVSARSNLRRIHEEAQNCADDDALDALDYIIGWAQDADDAATKALEKPE